MRRIEVVDIEGSRISVQGNPRNGRARTRITNLRWFDSSEPKDDRKGRRKLNDFC
ncbi:hypothetical protein Scep_021948 [Stephania cephalantha]|uniref:Uncharacterized protein n=1 Tax=Stephania cephalantha TaxID=152367 RepID=A0AAP0I292_9MAGN